MRLFKSSDLVAACFLNLSKPSASNSSEALRFHSRTSTRLLGSLILFVAFIAQNLQGCGQLQWQKPSRNPRGTFQMETQFPIVHFHPLSYSFRSIVRISIKTTNFLSNFHLQANSDF